MGIDYYLGIEEFNQTTEEWVCKYICDFLKGEPWSWLVAVAEVQEKREGDKLPVFDWKTCSPEIFKEINYSCQTSEPVCVWLGGNHRLILYSTI